MSKMELILIIVGALIPFVAVLFVLPKFKKKDKTPPPTTTYVKEEKSKVEEKPAQTVESPKPKVANYSLKDDDDFKSYLELRKKRLSAIQAKDSSLATHPTEEFVPARLRNKFAQTKEDKTVVEQINDLSPELKALIISGVLDKKQW